MADNQCNAKLRLLHKNMKSDNQRVRKLQGQNPEKKNFYED